MLSMLFSVMLLAATSQPAENTVAFPFWHTILTAEDEGLFVDGMFEIGAENRAMEFPGSRDLQVEINAISTPTTIPFHVEGDRVTVEPSGAERAMLKFHYWLPWQGREPVTIRLSQDQPIASLMVSLVNVPFRMEAKGLRKETINGRAVYLAENVGAKSDTELTVYPPAEWWGLKATKGTLLASVIMLAVFLCIKMTRRSHG